MGGPKTLLLQRDSYSLLKATELAAEMLADYERALDGGREMRVEETTEPLWDDIVVHHSSRTDKWQVKRQTTDFGLADAEKLITAAVPLTAQGVLPTHHHFGFMELVAIGKGKTKHFDCGELRELCDASRVPNLDVAGFVTANQKHAAFKFIRKTLPATVTDDTIVKALQNLHVHRLGTEAELRSKAASHLHEFFENADVVVTQLHAWFGQNPNGLIRIDATLLHELVIDKYAQWQPSKGRWVHLSRRGTSNWETRGPLPVDSVVDGAWGSVENVRIDVGSKPYSNDALSSTLSRLLVHRTRGADARAADVAEWQSAAQAACGGTLGIATDALPLACNAAACAGHPHPARLELTSVELADKLRNAMDARLWNELVEAVQQQLHEGRFATDVRDATLKLWEAWQNDLTTPELRAGFLRSMLATAEEATRSGLDASVRSGRLLIGQLARATIIGLAIACGLAAVGRSSSLAASGVPTQNLNVDGGAAHLIALHLASHPRDRKPCRIDEDPAHVLADERGTAILAAVGTGATELYALARDGALSLAAGTGASAGMTHRGPPASVLTASPAFLYALTLSLTDVGTHVAASLDQMAMERQRQLEAVVAEAVANG